MCAEGMGCGRRWVRWVLRGTGTASGHPRIVTVIAKIFQTQLFEKIALAAGK